MIAGDSERNGGNERRKVRVRRDESRGEEEGMKKKRFGCLKVKGIEVEEEHEGRKMKNRERQVFKMAKKKKLWFGISEGRGEEGKGRKSEGRDEAGRRHRQELM